VPTPRKSKKDPKSELADLLEQRRVLRLKLVNSEDRKLYIDLTTKIVSLKKKLNSAAR